MDEAVGLTAGVRILPFDGGKLGMLGGENFHRYVSRPTAGVMNVEGVEKLDQSLFLKRRQAKRRRKKFDALAAKTAHEAQCDIESEFKRNVGRHENGRTRAGPIAGETDVEFAGAIDNNKLTALVICVISDD
jgi:hypothetical protein